MTRFERKSLQRWLNREEDRAARRAVATRDTTYISPTEFTEESFKTMIDAITRNSTRWDPYVIYDEDVRESSVRFNPITGWFEYGCDDRTSFEIRSVKEPKVYDISLSEDVSISSLFGE